MKVLIKINRKIMYLVVLFIGKLKLKFLNVEFGNNLVLYDFPIVTMEKKSTINIGDRVVLCSSSKRTALGVNHPVVLRTLYPSAKIILQDDVGISGATICAAKFVSIGKRTMLGANVTVTDTDFHPINPINRRYNSNFNDIKSKEVTIGDDVFIGANSIVLKGVSIGSNSIIGAGSIVTSNIPENVIAAGNPCKIISNIEIN